MNEEYLLEVKDYRNCKIKIYYDSSVEDPFVYEQASFVSFHRDYADKNISIRHDSPQDVFDYAKENGLKTYMIRAYIHSGISLSLSADGYPFNDQWDSGWFGVLLLNPKDFGLTLRHYKSLREIAESIVHIYSCYLGGNVYGFVAEDENGEHLDSCWGFYPDMKGNLTDLLAEAEGSINYYIDKKHKKHQEQLKSYIKHNVPLEKRWVAA